MSSRNLVLLLAVLLAACGSLPRPFEGNPGATARRLSQPPPPRLAVPTPDTNIIAAPAGEKLAALIADGLLAAEVPADVAPAERGGWRLTMKTEARDGAVVPDYVVLDPKGEQRGITEGLPVPPEEWEAASDATLRRVAGEAVPRIASLLTRIEAERRQSDPNSLVNRAPKLVFTGITGAPGDGNTSLAATMKAELVKAGQQLYDSNSPADFRLAGQVDVVKIDGGKERVEIQWIVTDAAGAEAGRVVQLNEIKAGMLDLYWGDVALVVAQEAAGGVRDVIANRIATSH